MSDALTATADQIRDVDDRPVEKVPTPEWSCDCFVRILTGYEMDQVRDFHKGANILGCYAALLLCDQNGNRLFTLQDAEWLGHKNSNVLGRICDIGQVFNKITPKQQEEAAKN